MREPKYIIDEECFEGLRNIVVIKDYGDEFDPWWGYDTIELTKEDIEALLEGKVCETSCAGEYGVLIRMVRMERADDTKTSD